MVIQSILLPKTSDLSSVVPSTSLGHDRVPEILAPAGGRAQFFAALKTGADAVYLGLREFNARGRAENFSPEDLAELVPIAHHYGMKVLVTFNILIKDREIDRVLENLAVLERLEVDAIIVQDLAVAAIAREFFPELRLHASTQMAVHNLAGVLQAAEWGFRRVVLARELTSTEIRRLRQALPHGVEIEAFCHGSLCYSYSGLCFFSGASDARSGNRGECAYTCRQPYKVLNEPGHGFLFSMRDLDTSNEVRRFVDAGVDCLKIEGRKKDAQYVSSVVRLYRHKLDEVFGRNTLRLAARPLVESTGENLDDEALIRRDLALSFHRRGTSFFLRGRYVENVIDLDNPTHLGLPVGRVLSVGAGQVIVELTDAVERFDGLRIEAPEKQYIAAPQSDSSPQRGTENEALSQRFHNEVCQFPVRDMLKGGRNVPTAKAGESVALKLPDAPGATPRVGDIVFKTRSADLKRRVESLSTPPANTRLRSFENVSITIEVTAPDDLDVPRRAIVDIQVSKWGQEILRLEHQIVATIAATTSTVERDFQDLFSLFGDDGIAARIRVQVSSPKPLFIARGAIKEIKRQVAANLKKELDGFFQRRLNSATETLLNRFKPVPAHLTAETLTDEESNKEVWRVKIDRLETLENLISAIAALNTTAANPWHIAEVIFEPKRAFLKDDAQRTFQRLISLTQQLGASWRVAVPTVLRAWDEPSLKLWVESAFQQGCRRFEAGNIGALKWLESLGFRRAGIDISGDFTLYSLNRVASAFWRDNGVSRTALSIEDDLENLASHLRYWPAGIRAEAIVFKDTPLFIAEACSLTALHNGCPTSKVCGYRTLDIENEKGERFHVAHESCKSIVYGAQAFACAEHLPDFRSLGVRDFRIDFLTRPYSMERIQEVLLKISEAALIPSTHSANLKGRLL